MNDCKVLNQFECCGIKMVTVMFRNSDHVMEVKDLKRIRRIFRYKEKKRWKMKDVA